MSTVNKQQYEPLTESTAIELAIQLNLFSEKDALACTEIGDGNLNLVFRIQDQKSEKSVIVKQALPYAKVVGESWPLTLHRATIEAEALKLFGAIVPQYVPEVYFSDETLAITVMEDLSHLSIARTGLIQGNDYPLLARHLGEYVAKTLFYTSDYALEPSKKKELVQKFINPELCKITEDLIFTDPYFDIDTNSFEEELAEDVKELWVDGNLKLEVALLKKSFLTEAEALLHGDLHTGSIFAGKETTKVIDPEFAFYGPVGFDIGQVIANLLFQSLAFPEKRGQISSYIKTYYDVFEEQYTALWNSPENKELLANEQGYLSYLLAKYLRDAIGFAGTELIRRTIGLAHVADLDLLEDKEYRLEVKRKTLSLGRQLIVNRDKYSSIDEVLESI